MSEAICAELDNNPALFNVVIDVSFVVTLDSNEDETAPKAPEMSDAICAELDNNPSGNCEVIDPDNIVEAPKSNCVTALPETTTFFQLAIILNFNYLLFFYLLKCCTPCYWYNQYNFFIYYTYVAYSVPT